MVGRVALSDVELQVLVQPCYRDQYVSKSNHINGLSESDSEHDQENLKCFKLFRQSNLQPLQQRGCFCAAFFCAANLMHKFAISPPE